MTYSTLAIGAHTFAVTAADAAGNVSAPANFTWTVVTPAQAIQNLIATIGNLGLPVAVADSLTAPLITIDVNDVPATCVQLHAFTHQVHLDVRHAQLTTLESNQLLRPARAIEVSLGCP